MNPNLNLVGIEVPGAPKVTAKNLMRHAFLYGSDDVEDLGRMYGIVLDLKGIPSKKKPPEILRQIRLQEAGRRRNMKRS